MHSLAGALVVFGFGLNIGSFLNVVIVRLPERRSLWRPRSACPSCRTTIAWYDNIPVLSFVALRGRCRACRAPISWRYPVVELTTAILWVVAYAMFGFSPMLVVALVFLSALIVITAIDLVHRIIPHAITLPGIVAGLIANLVIGPVTWLDSLIGIVVGAAIFALIIFVSGLFYPEGGMGGGDMMLAAMFGAFLGWKAMLAAVFVAIMLGGLVGGALLISGKVGRRYPIPFGPFLAVGGTVGLLWGDRIIRWYLNGFPS